MNELMFVDKNSTIDIVPEVMDTGSYFVGETKESKKERMVRANKLRLLYIGYKGDQGTAFEYKGVSFMPRQVHNVTPSVYDVFKNFHNFIVVDGIKEIPLHFPGSYL